MAQTRRTSPSRRGLRHHSAASLYADDIDWGTPTDKGRNANPGRSRGDWGYYEREQSLRDAGMPGGQVFASVEAAQRYANTVMRQEGIDIPVTVYYVDKQVGESYSQVATDKSAARIILSKGMLQEDFLIHELAHIVHRFGGGKGASHGKDFAAVHARMMHEYMGVSLRLFGSQVPPSAQSEFGDGVLEPSLQPDLSDAAYRNLRITRKSSLPGLTIVSRPISDPFVDGPIRLSDEGLMYDAKVGNDVVGWMHLRQRLNDGVWEVYAIRVYPSYQRQGVATALLDQARRDLGRVEHAPETSRSSDGLAWSTKVGARGGTYWRTHNKSRPFAPEHAYSVPMSDQQMYEDNLKLSPWYRPGYSAMDDPWHLWFYTVAMGWHADKMVQNDWVVEFSGREITRKDYDEAMADAPQKARDYFWDAKDNRGLDGEFLVIPDMRVVNKISWSEFERLLLRTPMPPSPQGSAKFNGHFDTWEKVAESLVDRRAKGLDTGLVVDYIIGRYGPRKTAARSWETGQWFHGTNAVLQPGDHVVPGLGAVHGDENDRVWVASNAWVASAYGSRTYEVEPDEHPRARSKAGEFFCSGARVIREVPMDEVRVAGNTWWEWSQKKGTLGPRVRSTFPVRGDVMVRGFTLALSPSVAQQFLAALNGDMEEQAAEIIARWSEGSQGGYHSAGGVGAYWSKNPEGIDNLYGRGGTLDYKDGEWRFRDNPSLGVLLEAEPPDGGSWDSHNHIRPGTTVRLRSIRVSYTEDWKGGHWLTLPAPMIRVTATRPANDYEQGPFRKIISVEPYEPRPGVTMWRERLECGHDGKLLSDHQHALDVQFGRPRAKRRCWYCSEYLKDIQERRKQGSAAAALEESWYDQTRREHPDWPVIDGVIHAPDHSGQWHETKGVWVFQDAKPPFCLRAVAPQGDSWAWEVRVPVGFGPNSGKTLSGTAKTLDAAKDKAMKATRKDEEATDRYMERQRELLGRTASANTLYRGMELRGINQDDALIEAMRSNALPAFVQGLVRDTVMRGDVNQWSMRMGDRGQGVGVHWTTDLDIAKSFSLTNGERFTVAMFDSWLAVVLEATYTPGSEVENPEENSHAYGWNGKDEKEVPLKPGSPLTLVRAHVLVPSRTAKFLADYDEEGEAQTDSVKWITVPLGLSAVASTKMAWGEDHAFTIVNNTDMSAQKFVRWLAPDFNSAWVQPDGTVTACYTHAHVGEVDALLDQGWVRMDVMPAAGTVFVQATRPLTEDQIQSVRVCVMQSGATRVETSTGLGDAFNLRTHPASGPAAVSKILGDFTSLSATASSEVRQLGTPRLKYDYAGQVQRIGIIDPSSGPPKPGWTYFTHEPVEDWRSRKRREEWEAGNGTTKRKPAQKFQEGSGTADEGTVAFLDYIERPDEIFIAYMNVREDQRRRGLAKKLVDWVYERARQTGKARVNWGQVFYPANQMYWDYADRDMGVQTVGKPLDGRMGAKRKVPFRDFFRGMRVVVSGHEGTVTKIHAQGNAYRRGYVTVVFDEWPDQPTMYPWDEVEVIDREGRTAARFSPEQMRSWETDKPWNLTVDQAKAQSVDGWWHQTARGSEVASWNQGHIRASDEFFRLPEETRRAIAYHEAGHAMIEAAGGLTAIGDPLALIDLPGGQSLGYNAEEIIAEAYSVLWSEPEWFERMGAQKIRSIVVALAKAAGFPLPSGHTAAGNIDYCKICGTRIQRSGPKDRWRHQRPQPSGQPWDHSPVPGGTKTAAVGLTIDVPFPLRMQVKAMAVPNFKGRTKNLSDRQVLAACQRILKDIAREFGYTGGLPDIVVSPDLPGGTDGRSIDPSPEFPNGAILLNEEFWLPNARDKEQGYDAFRILAHEAIHAIIQRGEKSYPGFSQMITEGGAEVLAVYYWAKNAPAFDDRDAVRRDGKWVPGDIAMVARSNYPEWVVELMRRTASKVGWNREAIVREVQRVVAGDHNTKLNFRDGTNPDFAPPPGVKADAESLLLWLIEGVRKSASATVRVYHGTSVERAERIRTEGLVPAPWVGWGQKHPNGVVYFTTDRQRAAGYADSIDATGGAVIVVDLPGEMVSSHTGDSVTVDGPVPPERIVAIEGVRKTGAKRQRAARGFACSVPGGREGLAIARRMQRGTATVEDILRCAAEDGHVGSQWGLESSEYGPNWEDQGAEDYAFVNDDTFVKRYVGDLVPWSASDDEIMAEMEGLSFGEVQVILVGETEAGYVNEGWDADIGYGSKVELTEVRYNAGWGWKRLPARGHRVTANVKLDRDDFLASKAWVNGIEIEFSPYGDAVPGGYNGGWVAYVNGKKVGYLDYQTARDYDEVLIAMVEVYPEWRGKGVADALLARLKAEYPGRPIDPGLMTPEGAKWWKRVAAKGDLGTQWYLPGKKRPFGTSTRATSDLVGLLAEDGLTFQEAYDAILYDDEAKALVQRFIDAGYGDTKMADLGVRYATKTASTGTIYRGYKIDFPQSIRDQIDRLTAGPMEEDEIDQHYKLGPILLDYLANNHWEAGVGLGRHWTTNRDWADTAALQGARSGAGVILEATYQPGDVNPDLVHTTPISAEIEKEVNIRPGATLTITGVYLTDWLGWRKDWNLLNRTIRARASYVR